MKPNIITIIMVQCIWLLVLAPQALANWVVTSEGVLVNPAPGQVLGEKTQTESEAENTEAVGSETPSNTTITTVRGSNKSETAPGQVKVEVKTKTQAQDQEKINTAIKIKVKDNQLELESDGEYEIEDEFELDEEVQSTESGSLEIEDNKNQNKTKIRAQNNAAYVIRNKVAAQSHFPLMVNLETNELIVTTPKGSKVVTVLPDAAVRNMLAANVLDQLGGKGGLRWLEYQESLKDATDSADLDDNDDATDSADLDDENDATPSADQNTGNATASATPEPSPTPEVVDEANNVIILTTTQDGTLVYEIEGIKNKKLLGFKPVDLERTVIVSAETGELVRVVQDLRTRLLDLLSV